MNPVGKIVAHTLDFRNLGLWAVVTVAGPGTLWGQTADVRLTALASPSVADAAPTPPASSSYFLNDDSFVVEVWAQTSDARGLSSVSVDLAFTNAVATLTGLTHSATFNVLTAGTINNGAGTVDNLAGSHLGPCADAIGVSPNWARVAILNVAASASGAFSMQSGPTGSPIYGTAVCGLGDIADAQIAFGSVTVTLVECLASADCDDGQFCDGTETCNIGTHVCEPGTAPSCDDGIECTDDSCDPLAAGGSGACANVPNHARCDNQLYCDGLESCSATLGCVVSPAPCTAACEHCVEATDSCELCIFDLDGSGIMGTGDFSFFAACFGGCYPSGDPCLASNFNEDPAGCVGTADFAAFVGCFGDPCESCAGCAGPGEGGLVVAVDSKDAAVPSIRVRLVARRSASESDTAESPPLGESSFGVGEHIFVEIWTRMESNDTGTQAGLASAYVDLRFDARRMKGVNVLSSKVFGLFADAQLEVSGDAIRGLGGCASLGRKDVGIQGWVKVASVVVRATAPGAARVVAGPSDELHGFSRVGMFQNVDPSLIEFEGTTVQIGKRQRALDGR